MSEKIDVRELIITAPMIGNVVIGKPKSTDETTEQAILSKLALELWWGTQLETVDWSSLAAVKIAINEQGYMDITTITQSQWMSDGYAQPATTNGTPSTARD